MSRRHEPPRVLSHESFDFHFSCPLVDAHTGVLETPDALELAPFIDAMRGQTTQEPRPTRNVMITGDSSKLKVTYNGLDISTQDSGYLVDQDAIEKAFAKLGPGDPLLCRLGWHRGWTPWANDEPGLKSRCCDRCFTVQVRPT